MPKNMHRSEQDFSRYDSMPSEELAQILRADSEAPEGNGLDIDTLLYITGVLAERKTSKSKKPAREAWESFQENYLPLDEPCPEPAKEKEVLKFRKPWVRRIAAAAAVVVLAVVIPLSAKALNWEKIWNTVAIWAKETFSFVRGDQPDIGLPEANHSRTYDSLQQALEQMGLDPNLVPSWIPERYEYDEVVIDQTPSQTNIVAVYRDGETSFKIVVQSFAHTDPQRVEINENLIELYTVNDTDYYIFNNLDYITALWIQNNTEYSIFGKVTVEELKTMINSIPKG